MIKKMFQGLLLLLVLSLAVLVFDPLSMLNAPPPETTLVDFLGVDSSTGVQEVESTGRAGNILFVTNRNGREEIWEMNPDGSGQEFVVEGTDPKWSPDGSGFVFTHNGDLYVVTDWAPGKPVNAQKITASFNNYPVNSAAAEYLPSPGMIDGFYAFVSERDGNPEIYARIPGSTGAGWNIPTETMEGRLDAD